MNTPSSYDLAQASLGRAWLSMLIFHAAFVLIMPVALVYIPKWDVPWSVAGLFFWFASFLFWLLNVAAVLAIRKRQRWPRALTIVMSLMYLPVFPVGTGIGLYMLYQSARREWYVKPEPA
jgi:hypothetical protein